MRRNRLASVAAAYKVATTAARDAVLDVHLVRERNAPLHEVVAATRRLVEAQVEVLAAHDRFITRSIELGVDTATVARLRDGRAQLALRLQQASTELGHLQRQSTCS